MWRSEHFNCCFIRTRGITTETLVFRHENTQQNYTLAFYSDSNSEKEVYFGGRGTARPRDLSTNAMMKVVRFG